VSRAGSQQRTLLGILGALRPHWRNDPSLPSRIDSIIRGDRRFGSRDRRLYRELVYTVLRYLPWIEPLLDPDPAGASARTAWLAADTPAVRAFREALTEGMAPCPAGVIEKADVLGVDAEALIPAWFRAECPEAFTLPLLDVLQSRAPLWVRIQSEDPAAVLAEFEGQGWAWNQSPFLKNAVSLPQDADVTKTEAYRGGQVEIQDVGSQLILESVGVKPGGHWLDACAGAGGKTLQLAALLGASGHVTARDVRRAALLELSTRVARAGMEKSVSVGSLADPVGGYEGVLVDAPCSGSGTWRRSPHLKWVTTEKGVREAAATQLSLLRNNAALVKQGGTLVYATCSLCRSENESVVEAFLAETKGFSAIMAGKRLLPQSHDGDGYFVASFRRLPQAS
jgi:16S rRNA (cytosine967-C5)-methyltransferase